MVIRARCVAPSSASGMSDEASARPSSSILTTPRLTCRALRGRGDASLFARGVSDLAICPQQVPACCLHLCVETDPPFRPRRDTLGCRERFRILFHALHAEELASNRLVRLPRDMIPGSPQRGIDPSGYRSPRLHWQVSGFVTSGIYDASTPSSVLAIQALELSVDAARPGPVVVRPPQAGLRRRR